MARISRNGFVAIAVIFHLLYSYSIFDIYFVSPIVRGMTEFSLEAPEAPATRLVLFVGDGLRADKAFQSFPDPSPLINDSTALEPRPLAPFLRSKVLSAGTFGVSHTRVPTESRPGHVALIAGLYEDVSAVLTGWKLNPVNFDSVFNRSRHTWSWGSPDILPMFKEGAVPGRVDADMYGAEAEDFTADSTQLDIWVFDKVKQLFKDAKNNQTLDDKLRRDKNVFFLHLLGLDTAGHSYRPYSREYLNNIKVVDKGVQEITELVEDFFGDDRTAFVFTADHGMSDWGSHGDGHPDNTRTPLIVWGSGVAPPIISTDGPAKGHEDGLSSDWGLEHVQRNDVAQADVAALMAYLVGLAFPTNSVGELPLNYMKADSKTKAQALLVNAKGILEMYRVKEDQKKAREIRFVPYHAFSGNEPSVSERIDEISRLIDNKDFDTAISRSTELIKTTLGGLRYLQTYDWLFLRTLVTVGYLGWIAFAVTTIIDMHILHGQTEELRTVPSMMFFSSVLVALYSVLYVQKSSWTYYAYAVFPVIFWEEVYARRGALIKGKQALFSQGTSALSLITYMFNAVAFIGLLEALVQSYFYREIFSICYLLGALWPLLQGFRFLKQNTVVSITWVVLCSLMSVFTLIPVVKVESIEQILLGGFLMLLVGVLYLTFEKSILVNSKSSKEDSAEVALDPISRMIFGAQIGLIVLAMIVTKSGVQSLQDKEGLPLGTQVLGWTVFVASLIVPFFHGWRPNNHYIHRLVIIFLAFSPTFIILTISYEGFFYFVFCATVFTWVRLEYRIHCHHSRKETSVPSKDEKEVQSKSSALVSTQTQLEALKAGNYRIITLADARISLFFLFLLQSAFFSTGNIASVSSFSLDAVNRLIPVFDPFSQAALLIFKIMIPFAIISANLGILNRRIGVAPSALFMIVMAISDVMTLNFFYMVKDEGSWLEIGSTITNFVIGSGLSIFVAGLEFFSELFVGGVSFEHDSKLGILAETVHDLGAKIEDNDNDTPNGNGK